MKTFFTFVISLLLFFPIQSQDCSIYVNTQFDSITQIPDIFYGSAVRFNGDTIDLELDIYYPEFDTNTSRPLLVAVHGGGFLGGSKNAGQIVKLCKEFAKRGYVTASISYRLGFRNEHDPLFGEFHEFYGYDEAEMIRAIYRSVQDARGAIRFMKGEADTYGIDTTNVFIGGESAGGFVSLHTAYMKQPDEKPDAAFEQSDANYYDVFGNVISTLARPDLGSLEGDLNLNGTSSDLKGAINIYGGIFDLELIDCGEPDLYQHYISDDILVFCGAAKAFHQTPGLYFPFTGNTKNPIIYGPCSIRNYIQDSLDCCDLKEVNNILPSNILVGPNPHNYLSNNSINIFFEDAPLFVDSTICKVSLEIIDQDLTAIICEDESTELIIDAVGCNLAFQWYKNNQLISDANTITYEASEEGNYYLEIIDCNGCSMNSLDISVEVIPLPDPPIIQINQDSIMVSNGINALSYQWFFNGDLILNATDQFYIPSQSGNYSVQVTNDFGCQSESTPFNFTVTNTANLAFDQAIQIFPNPANVILNMESSTPIESGKIYNSQGKIIQLIQRNARQIDINYFENGIYFLEVQTDKVSQVLKFIKF
ncbi:MAG: T9SS type A sorting domain-containing protein [Saprospiraceae bacterium]